MLPVPNPSTVSHTVLRLILGPLETQVMEVLWANGECRVREVIKKLNRKIAYTTVVSTLDRLFKKNLVSRQMRDRVYLYTPRVSRQEWTNKVARDVVAKLLAGPRSSREVLIACLLEAVVQQEGLLLREIKEDLRPEHPELCNGGTRSDAQHGDRRDG